MDSDGSYTDDEWASIYGAGGASPVPSFVSTHYVDPRYSSRRHIPGTWLLAFGSFFLPLFALLAVPSAVRAGLKGNWFGWLAALVAVGCAVSGSVVLWTP